MFFTPFTTRAKSFSGSVKQGWDSSFRLRAGVLITPFTLAYVTGGLAVGEVSGSFSYLGTLITASGSTIANTSVNASWNETRVGGTVGGGLEQALGPFIKARVEYRYTTSGSTRNLFRSPRLAEVGRSQRISVL